MKQTLQLKMGQQLTMTPQLQQAIRLLQLSSLELQQEIRDALDSNVMLEEGAEDERKTPETKEDTPNPEAETPVEKDINAELALGDAQEIPNELPVDTVWEDVYDGQTYQSTSSAVGEEHDASNYQSELTTLNNHLLAQMQLCLFTETDFAIATALIDAIDPTGYLPTTLPALLDSLQDDDIELDKIELDKIELDEVEAVLHRIQQFDPPGVGARNLQECLLIQLRQLPRNIPHYATAQKILTHHMQVLASCDMLQLKRKLKIDETHIKGAVALIKTLNPRPGDSIESDHAQYITPDVYVSRNKNGAWRVELNIDASPKLRINTGYAGLIRRADDSPDNTCLKNHLQEARWFLKSLQSRNETLMKVATSIVAFQKGFFEYGDEAMKPLVLREIAATVEMHESTISRVTSHKYMHTPKGIFEFKYFFSSHVNTNEGGECSATAIRALIKKLITQEPPQKPLSDNKLSQLLAEQGIKVARRTVAKYREAMSVPPSNERKRLL